MSGAVQERNGTEKVSLVFSGEGLRVLTEIAEREGKRLDEVVEDALGLKRWTLAIKDEGGEIIVRRRFGRESELKI